MRRENLELNEFAECWTEEFVLFWQPPSPLSQWTPSPFRVDGVAYGCAEQFMMAEKARLFGDAASLAKILASPNPTAQRALGRKVSPFVGARWDAARLDVVVRGNIAKFGQLAAMREHLLATGSRRLVEASPRDRIWGIGLAPTNPEALDPRSWRGRNLLGEALTRVRDALRGPGEGRDVTVEPAG